MHASRLSSPRRAPAGIVAALVCCCWLICRAPRRRLRLPVLPHRRARARAEWPPETLMDSLSQ